MSPVIGMLAGSGNITLQDANGAPVTLDAGSNGSPFTFYGGQLNGSGGFTKSGGGKLAIADNSYTGNTNINGGTIETDTSNGLPNSSVFVNVNGGLTFGSSVTTANLGALGGGGNIALNNTASSAVNLSAGGNNGSTTYSGILSGSGTLTKVGTGTLTLSGSNANSYTGAMAVNTGLLVLAKATGNQANNYGSAVGDLYINSGASAGSTLARRFVTQMESISRAEHWT